MGRHVLHVGVNGLRQIKSKAYGYLSLLDYACQLKTTGMLS